jgi:hypothetical protein
MAGTPAQKEPVLAEAVSASPTQTVEGQARLTPQAAPQQAPAPQLERLKQLGSYGTRLQTIIQNRANQLQTVAAQTNQLDDAAVARLTAGKGSAEAEKIRQALTTYGAGGRTEADLVALAAQTGLDTLKGGTLAGLFKQQDAGAAAQGAYRAPVTVQELDLAQAGIDPAQLAQDLGVTPEVLASYTPDQLQAAVQGVVAREFSVTEGLRAERRTASQQRKQQIDQELRARGESGATVAEAAAGELAELLESQEEVEFAGERKNVADLLKDDTVSRLVTEASLAPERLAALKANPSTAALGAWIESNKGNLAALAQDMADQVLQVGKVQDDYQAEIGSLAPELQSLLGVKVDGPVTTAKLAALKAARDAHPVYQAYQADPDTAAWVDANPKALDQLKGMSAADIQSAVKFTRETAGDQILAKIAGLDPNAPLRRPTPDAMRAKESLRILGDKTAGPTFQKLLTRGLLTPDLVAEMTTLPDLMDPNDKKFGGITLNQLVQNGTIDTASELRFVLHNPSGLQAMQRRLDERDAVEAAMQDPAQAMQLLFGANVEPAVVQRSLEQSPAFAKADEAIRQASAAYEKQPSNRALEKARNDAIAARRALAMTYDTNKDGRLSPEDFGPEGLKALAGRLRDQRSDQAIFDSPGASTPLDAWVSGVKSQLSVARGAIDRERALKKAQDDAFAKGIADAEFARNKANAEAPAQAQAVADARNQRVTAAQTAYNRARDVYQRAVQGTDTSSGVRRDATAIQTAKTAMEQAQRELDAARNS